MFTWHHCTGYPEDHYSESGLTAKEIIERLKDQSSFYWEYDRIVLDNPNPEYDPHEFIDKFG